MQFGSKRALFTFGTVHPEQPKKQTSRMGMKDVFAFWLAYLTVMWPFLLISLGVLIGVYGLIEVVF
ncbi:MAG: hypothetical protein ABF904_12180 [Ethanoligenens sp.]